MTKSKKLRSRIDAVFKRLAKGALLPRDVVSSNDLKVRSSPHWIESVFEKKQVLEEDAKVFRRFTAEMGTILDVGAHWGYMAMSIRLTGTNCPIISFEALNAHKQCLQRLKELDEVGYDFRIIAISDRINNVTLYGPVVNGCAITGLNSINGSIFHGDWYAIYLTKLAISQVPISPDYRFQLLESRIRCRPLDALLRQSKFSVPVDKIAAIKIDVEGHELEVLEGAKKTIIRDLPFIMTEAGNRVSSVAAFMRTHGYLFAFRNEDQIVQSMAKTREVNGYWFHSKRKDEYMQMGFLTQLNTK